MDHVDNDEGQTAAGPATMADIASTRSYLHLFSQSVQDLTTEMFAVQAAAMRVQRLVGKNTPWATVKSKLQTATEKDLAPECTNARELHKELLDLTAQLSTKIADMTDRLRLFNIMCTEEQAQWQLLTDKEWT